MQSSEGGKKIRFGLFEADPGTCELWRDGRLIRIQEQPFQILLALVERRGEVVSRDELRLRLWPADTFGEFDQSLNTAINKLREALGDSAASPRYIETLPKRGYRFIHSVIEDEPAPATAVSEVPAKFDPAPRSERQFQSKHTYFRIGIGIVILLALAGISSSRWMAAPRQTPQLRHFTLRFDAPISSTPDLRLIAGSPNGKHVAIIAPEKSYTIWIQDMDQPKPRLLEGSAGASTVFWSPDSSMIGFVSSNGMVLKKAPAKGGAVMLVSEWPIYISGASWSPDSQSIVFASGTPSSLYTVAAQGGTPAILVATDSTPSAKPAADKAWMFNPNFLQTEKGVSKLLYSSSGSFVVRDVASGVSHVIGQGRNGAYDPAGYLVYQSGSDLWARKFSADEMKWEREPFLLVRMATDPTITSDGTLIYRDLVTSQLVWRDRQSGARISPVGQEASAIFYPTLSPDGERVAAEVMDNENLDIWVTDISRGTRIRLSSDPSVEVVPVWSADGREVAYSSYRAGNLDIFSRQADAERDETLLANGAFNERVSDWSRDRRYILYSTYSKNRSDLAFLDRGSGKWESHSLLKTQAHETAGKMSPDGKYVAYLSDESGRIELYLREFAPGGRKWPISSRGASQHRWGRDGRELFYVENGTLLAVPISLDRAGAAAQPVRLFSHPAFTGLMDANYDVSADGKRVIVPERVGDQERFIHVIQNWLVGIDKAYPIN